MSRCYPFPPPGYEKKAKLADTDLLIKDKHNNKKHKKDKNREKKEGKETKNDRDRSNRKHKEKKDRKEKHRDRNDTDKDQEKRRVLLEENIVGPLEVQNGENFGSNCQQIGETMDSNYLLELGKRIRDEGGARANHMFQSISAMDQRSNELPERVLESNIGNSTERKYTTKGGCNRNVNGQQSKIVSSEVGCAFVQVSCEMDENPIEGVAGPVYKDIKAKERHKLKDKDSRGDRHEDRDCEKKSKSKDKGRTKENENEIESNKELRRMKESNKDGIDSCYKSFIYNGNLGKRKEPGRNGFLRDDDNRVNKLPRPISSSPQLVENGRKLEQCERHATTTDYMLEGKNNYSHQILQNGRKLEPTQSAIFASTRLETANRSTKDEEARINGKKDKEGRICGMIEAQQLYACSSKPLSTIVQAKVKVGSKPLSAPLQAKLKVESKPLSARLQAKVKVESKHLPTPVRANVKVESKPLSAPVQANAKAEACAKIPHPDSKFLSQILSVPELVDLSDFDDPEWLFSSKNLYMVKAKAGSVEVDKSPLVWAEALRMEFADVTALPYVVPF